ncbi:transcription elongation factor GreB [Alloalcanivorax profundimaris]|uniref:transcription elongation factor GreB n=1 Tax=Alloalcanivorax profundimaris TaxID=2735259 RepID=UPI000C37DAFC|nr:transcription elongation factor GreB [Alloalcanivorax profundimaris]MAY10490.1 transcription elongation factor GreB [Alcanivorax sp.]MBM1145930.1 transcription elongation factor GreB [Alcanivorax sp. ZXX171]MCQ6260714.1 transcription elongation factor GreB [Alcanivorax sp. MM125-6]UWN50533.1 Transcription elongation factor GreB [Alcanivorax sp. ALC70]MBF1801138.1 transcription elongation factor GreB [Alloalcanivorax profundimaris]|tara:strand:- start:88740 stop:89243 length:504 start_codon:yes stop_codon:yes gene_type:complete
MGRWRPKGKPASKYITPEGYRRLNEELQRLWKEERPPITKSVQEAAAQGDRSENAEYIYGKKQLREIDRRIRFLSKRLDGMTVVDRPPEDPGKVFFGAWVELEDDDGKLETYRLVGPDEAVGSDGLISIDAPLARALLGKRVDDEARVRTPTGERCLYINRIWYGRP